MKKLLSIILIIQLFCTVLLGQSVVINNSITSPSSPLYGISTTTSHLKLDLETALGLAITNNIQLKAVQARRKVNDLTVWERWREYFPTLSLSYFRSLESKVREADNRTHTLNLNSELVVYDGGKRGLNLDIARLTSILARKDYRLALNNLIIEVNESFFTVLQLRDTISIHKKTLERGTLQLKFIKKELSLGDATKLDVLEIETQIKEVELNYQKARDDYGIALNRLKLLLKLDYRQPLELLGSIENDMTFSPLKRDFTLPALVATAHKKRKEIEKAQVELAISRKSYLINKLYYFPKFSLGFNYNLTDEEFFPRDKGWGVNFKVTSSLYGNTASLDSGYKESGNGSTKGFTDSATVNVLDNLAYKRNIVESEIDLNTKDDTNKYIKQQIALEVITSYNALNNAWKLINISKKRLELYDSQLKIERLKANLGSTRRFDLMEKEIERGEAAIAHLNSRVRYLLTSLTLETSIGMDVGFLKLAKMHLGASHEKK